MKKIMLNSFANTPKAVCSNGFRGGVELKPLSRLTFATMLAGAALFGVGMDTAQADEVIGNLPAGVTVTPTLTDKASRGESPIDSAYYVDANGTMYLKDSAVSHTRFINHNVDNSGTNYADYYLNLHRSGTASYIGSAIYNYDSANAKLGDIIGDFINSGAKTTGSSKYVYGGAIYNNKGSIGNITGDFVANKSESASGVVYGGAIYNSGGKIGNITGNFINNFANGGTYARGSAIYNAGSIEKIEGNFIGNHINGKNATDGGVIYNNEGKINQIIGNFIDNSTTSSNAQVRGAVIYHSGSKNIEEINGNFINNTANAGTYAYGGAIYSVNGSTISKIKGDFIGNQAIGYTEGSSGAIHADMDNGRIELIDGNFIQNHTFSKTTYASGGATKNTTHINTYKGYFKENYAISEGSYAWGGAINNHINTNYGNAGIIDNLIGYFEGNYTKGIGEKTYSLGGAIRNGSTIGNINADFKNNYAESENSYAFGGAIYNTSTIGSLSGSFKDNYAKTNSDTYLALGGAIFHTGDGNNLNLTADGVTNTFSGNYTQDYRGKESNAIFLRTNTSTSVKDEYDVIIGYDYADITPKLTLKVTNGGKFVVDDTIDGGDVIWEDIHDGAHHGSSLERKHQYDLEITGDSSGKVEINNDILNANITHNKVTTNVSDAAYLSHAQGEGINSLTMNSGNLNISNLSLDGVNFKALTLNGGAINLNSVDVDLEAQKMGRLTAKNYSGSKTAINVNSLNLLTSTDRLKTEILFADDKIKSAVNYKGDEVVAYSPVYKYDVSYQSKNDGGYFSFVRHGMGDDSGSFNPAVLSTPVSVQAAGISTINHAFDYAFSHSDGFMAQAQPERFSQIHGNRVALSTDYNENLGHIDLGYTNKGLWVKPYTAFESVPLKHGPKVDSITYGMILGGDSDVKKLKHGWAHVQTAYLGYNGSKLKYDGVDATTNGGLLGLTETLYKGNFFTAMTLSAGAGFSEAHSMYGKDDITFLMAGIANKTGYNFEFKEGKFIIQPMLQTSYSMVKAFDYTNAAGVRVKSDAAHSLQIAPTLKFIGNLKNGWQPYASVGMVWDVMHESNTTANGIKLPEMYTKPYVQYGVGLQRCWADKFSAYGQAMVRNGGRRGIMFTFGFRWALGKNSKELTSVPATKTAKYTLPHMTATKKLVIKNLK